MSHIKLLLISDKSYNNRETISQPDRLLINLYFNLNYKMLSTKQGYTIAPNFNSCHDNKHVIPVKDC